MRTLAQDRLIGIFQAVYHPKTAAYDMMEMVLSPNPRNRTHGYQIRNREAQPGLGDMTYEAFSLS